MLSYNSVVFVLYSLFLILIMPCLLYMNAEVCSGYDLVEKNPRHDDHAGESDA